MEEILNEYYVFEQTLLRKRFEYNNLNESDRIGSVGRNLRNEIFRLECIMKSYNNIIKRIRNKKYGKNEM